MHFATAVLTMLACQAGLSATAQSPTPNVQTFRDLAKAAGLPSPRNHPFVEVQTGGYSRSGNQAPVAIMAKGILLEDDGTSFRILNERFQEVTYRRTTKSTPKVQQVKYGPADAQQLLRRHLRQEPGWDGTFDLFYGWIADGLDKAELAEQLFARVETTHKHRTAGHGFETAAEIDFGFARYEDAVQSFAAKNYSDADRLAKLDVWLAAFANHELFAEAKDLRGAQARAMARTLRNDASPIERYVHRLTETETGVSISGGWPFVMPVHGGARPADKLYMIGIEAVPALLAALDDDRPSRSVRNIGRRSMRSDVMRIDRIAAQILDAIAGLGVGHLEPENAKPQLLAWQQRVIKIGATNELLERARQGNQAACQRLLYVAPDLLADAVQTALPTLNNDYQKGHLLQLVARTESAGARKLLREALGSGDGVTIAAVAEQLLQQPEQRDAAQRALLRAWQQAAAGSAQAKAIAPLLCAHGTAHALRALAKNAICLTGPELRQLPGVASSPTRDADYWQAQEQLLVQLLAYQHGKQTTYAGTLDARLCDFAAAELARRWPQRFTFDFSLLRVDRDRALQRLRNDQVPPTVQPSPRALADAQQQLDAWHNENLASQRERILNGITEVAALPLLRQTREKVFKVRRQELDVACSRLAATVLSVGPSTELDRLGTAQSDRFRALEGKPLDAREFATLLGDLIASPCDGIKVHTIEVLRGTNDAGLVVRLHSEPGDGAVRERPQYRIAFAFDGEARLDSTGAGLRRSVKKTAFQQLTQHLALSLELADRAGARGKPARSPGLEARIELRQRQ